VYLEITEIYIISIACDSWSSCGGQPWLPANCAVELTASVMRGRRDAAVDSFKSNFCHDIQVCGVLALCFQWLLSCAFVIYMSSFVIHWTAASSAKMTSLLVLVLDQAHILTASEFSFMECCLRQGVCCFKVRSAGLNPAAICPSDASPFSFLPSHLLQFQSLSWHSLCVAVLH